ncbi:DUF2637 domain-containing protein [Actinomadura bangladeshensis]|uniref:DUF2637 domain-containing protein n=1 Tax=Actinomadura bangladeshensis TaxID=453573 RepID=A0A4R4NXR0_9ACTN|nr:DUF2637 domain-containing protein [Actinomadura bangladeshensis]TDC12272.1 hypothetical protein E1284_24285 [Actinomadura bangladeshensis]
MPSDRTPPSYSRGQRRLLTALAGLVVAALAAAAYVLTYDVLRELALAGRVSRRWAPLYPAMADTLVAMTILSLVVTRGARWWTRLLRWALLLVLAAGGAAASVQHSVRGYGSLPEDAVRAGVAVAPHVMLVIAIWLWLTMFKQIRVARPAAEEAAPVETQRGHVKVLEPAAPPLALEAPAAAEPPSESADEEPLIPFLPEPPVEHEPEPVLEAAGGAEPAAPEPVRAEDTSDGHEIAGRAPERQQNAGDEPLGYGGGLSSEPAPPLDALPAPRPPLDRVPALLPTDVELVRGRDREDAAEQRPVASTTRPDIVIPGADEDLHDTPPADRAEDPDAGDPPAKDWNPPPSGNFRSGPTPPVD